MALSRGPSLRRAAQTGLVEKEVVSQQVGQRGPVQTIPDLGEKGATCPNLAFGGSSIDGLHIHAIQLVDI